MADRTIRIPDGVPDSEFSTEFVQGMADRMSVSYYKYGRVADAYPHRVDAIASLGQRLQKYLDTGNTEWLMDVGNFAMIEFMQPSNREAHFRSTDSHESPGRTWKGEVDPSARSNAIPEFSKD